MKQADVVSILIAARSGELMLDGLRIPIARGQAVLVAGPVIMPPDGWFIAPPIARRVLSMDELRGPRAA